MSCPAPARNPVAPGADRFTAAPAVRLERMLRLHGGLGANPTGAAIIVDLLERLERAEAALMRRPATP